MPITMSGESGDGDFQILLDRQSALDIGAFVIDGIDISPGTAIPSDGDRRIDHALRGFLFTCGPDHIRHPERISESDERMFPLHGSLCGTPVRHTQMGEPDENPGCLAQTEVMLADGGRALVQRQWTIGTERSEVVLSDRVTNIGDTPFAPMLMYHINIGGWLLDDGTRISGAMFDDGERPWRFGDGESAHFCIPASSGATADWAEVRLGPFAALSGRSLRVRFSTATLPFLQMWRCRRGAADVISIEPVSHRIAKRPDLAAAGEMPMLVPGETIDYALAFQVR